MAKNAYSEFRIIQDVLDRQTDRYDCALVVLTSPQIEMPVRFPLYFPAPLIEPITVHVLALHPVDEQKEEIPGAKSPQVIRRLRSFISFIASSRVIPVPPLLFPACPRFPRLQMDSGDNTRHLFNFVSDTPCLSFPIWISRSVSAEILASLARSKSFSAIARRFRA